MNNVFLRISLRILSPLIFISSIYVLLKGHNEPGGGFIGGLLAALSWTLVKIGKGDFEKEVQKTNFYIMGIGLGISLLSGLYAVLFNKAAFSAMWGPGLYIPMLGMVKISTVLFFDLGVYIVILFASIKMLRSFMD
jgi:multicomponent Na+:H+ antiporter subunit B